MNDYDKIDYAIEETPVAAKWFRLELPYPKAPEPWFNANGLRRMNRLAYTKALLARLEFKINVDFKLDSNYHREKMVLFLAPQAEQYASWIVLNWDPK